MYNPNSITVPDGRIEHMIVSNQFVYPSGQVLQTNSQWNNKIQTSKFRNVANKSNLFFLFAISGVSFVNTIQNVYDGNNVFTIYETDDDSTTQLNLVLTPGIYNIGTLVSELQTELNNNTVTDGSYAVLYSPTTHLVTILYTPSSGSWSFFLEGLDTRTSQQQETYNLFGFQQNQDETSGNTLVGSNPYNVFFGLNNIYLCCSCLQFTSQYVNNKRGISAGALDQTIISIPISSNSFDYIYYEPKELDWYATVADPFSSIITWRVVDQYGNLIQSLENFQFNLHLQLYKENNML